MGLSLFGLRLVLKPKKTNQKRQREPRFAFMTKSDVDHLEDGYRWRKYGQKAVKNSPFPRSYYRCTSASCNVKKRVERSFSDPSIVVTTYEGQHIHPSPVMPRPSFAGAASESGFSATTFAMPMQRRLSLYQQQQQPLSIASHLWVSVITEQQMLVFYMKGAFAPTQRGLLCLRIMGFLKTLSLPYAKRGVDENTIATL
ncbi:hypothetical protein GH714_022626 [Hevea brasiliensis]|uniref:WRKY domain-containing protein n=1 Tax=Hevea brasiliensis TaxID=3981 RepID=A0A6A6NJM7_HEVBR|nr:hypothetical protein GH714_022626 [Hevea brasiliensis]